MQSPPSSTLKKPVTTYKGAEYHTVRRGDTIWEIAKRYDGVTAQRIITLNHGINVKDLKIGMKIRVR